MFCVLACWIACSASSMETAGIFEEALRSDDVMGMLEVINLVSRATEFNVS